jgi:hypothetical protein
MRQLDTPQVRHTVVMCDTSAQNVTRQLKVRHLDFGQSAAYLNKYDTPSAPSGRLMRDFNKTAARAGEKPLSFVFTWTRISIAPCAFSSLTTHWNKIHTCNCEIQRKYTGNFGQM